MNFDLDEEQRELREFALELAGRTEGRFWQVADQDYRFPAEFWASLTESGLLGIALPEEFGGLGKGLFDLTLAVEAVAEGGAGMEGGSLSLVLDEANAIGTTYLRAALLPDVRRDEVRGLLRDYVDARLEAVQSGSIAEGLRRAEDLQAQVWAQAVAIGQQHPNSIVVGLFVESLNEVIDLHAKRVTAGLRNRIPGAIWVGLFALAVLSLGAMGYHSGLVGTTRSVAVFAVAFAFSAVIALVVDLDRPQEGALTVSQQALIDVRQSMNPPAPC